MLRSRPPRGFALALTLFLIVILATVVFAALSISTLDSRTAQQDYDAARALYAARAGVADALSRLAFDYGWSSGTGNLGEETYSVVVVPKATNSSSVDKDWKVTSVGTYRGATRTIEAWVELESFAKYAYFTDVEFTSSNTPIRFASLDRLDGAVHTNGYFTISGKPQFSSEVTSANTGDSKYNATAFTYSQEGTQTDPSRFYRMDSGQVYANNYPRALDNSPTFSFAGGQSRVALPTDTGLIAANANFSYGTSASPRDTRLVFRDDGTAKVYQKNSGGSWAEIQTIRTDSAPGVTIHVYGQIEMEGTVHGRVTVGGSRSIALTGNLLYADETQDVLGLVAREDVVVDAVNESNNTIQYGDRYIHAMLMALNGSFRVKNHDSGSYRGQLHLFGGVIQNRRGPVGTGSASSISSGYAKDYLYDDKLVNRPPLNFPTTGSLSVRSIIDRGSLGSL